MIKVKTDFDAEVYLFAADANGGCPAGSQIESDCSSAGASGGHVSATAGSIAGIAFSPAADGTFLIAVDGKTANDVGRLSLQIDPAATNQTCSGAQQVTLGTSPTTVSGDTGFGVANEYGGDISCGSGAGPWPGPQQYFKVTLQGGTALAVRVNFPDLPQTLELPVGAGGRAAIYTSKGKPFRIIRKVIIRMYTWLNYF